MSEKKLKKENIESGQRVKAVRIGKGMTQEDFADIMGISTSALKKIESGENGVSAKVLRNLLGINVSSDYILVGERRTFDQIVFDVDNATAEEKIELFLKLFLHCTQGIGSEGVSKAKIAQMLLSFLDKED